jgi:hypothetical protein
MIPVMEPFGSGGPYLRYDPPAEPYPVVVSPQLQCPACGFDPEKGQLAPLVCPRCGSRSWHRYLLARRLPGTSSATSAPLR